MSELPKWNAHIWTHVGGTQEKRGPAIVDAQEMLEGVLETRGAGVVLGPVRGGHHGDHFVRAPWIWLLFLFAAASPPDSEEAKARRVCYWRCVRESKCREAPGACCICQCSQTCGLIKNGCPECGPR